MRIVHMDSGLGNQMLDYAEYIAIKKMNPEEECYLENVIYEIPDDAPGMFSQWNGYELDRIFGINPPNIKQLFSKEAWERIVHKVEDSRFWEDNWNNAPFITQAINDEGYAIMNLRGDTSQKNQPAENLKVKLRKQVTRFFRTPVGFHIKRLSRLALKKRIIAKENAAFDVFQKYPDNSFVGHSLCLKYKGFGIEKIDKEIREAFIFPPIEDEKNKEALKKIRSVNAVAIHARRSDLLFMNWYCYRYGFFRRAVHYIKKHVEKPEFFFFCDEKSVGWCQENEHIFGLDFKKDSVHFVDWNFGETSFRDMQLMAECKHNIFTDSSFGWWGGYLNRNPDKITCAPEPTINATHSF